MSRTRSTLALATLALSIFSAALILRPARSPDGSPGTSAAPPVLFEPPPGRPVTPTPAPAPGAVEVTFLGPEPVPGVDALLESLTEPARRSGADGVITWNGVPPGSGYRWKILSAHRRPLDRTREADFDFEKEQSAPHYTLNSRSAPFEVKPGEITKLTANLLLPGSVVGAIEVDPDNRAAAEVHLLHGLDALTYRRESVTRTAPGGGFRFAEVAPGRKTVEAWWDIQGTTSFASLVFEVHPGQEIRLPPLRAQEGHRLRGIVHLLGKEALPPGFRVADLRAELRFGVGGPGRRGSFLLTVPLDEPFCLTGLGDGRTLFSARVPREIPGVRWRNPSGLQITLPETSDFALHIQAQAQIPARLTCIFPQGQPSSPLEAYVVPDRESEEAATETLEAAGVELEQESGVRLPSISSAGETTFSLRPGTFHVWAFSTLPDRQAGQNYFGEGKITVGPGRPNALTINLGPGALLSGRIRNAAGKGFYSNICVRCPPFDAFKDPFVREVVSDAQGYFRMTGLPPGRELEIWRADQTLLVGPPGSETRVDLILGR